MARNVMCRTCAAPDDRKCPVIQECRYCQHWVEGCCPDCYTRPGGAA